MRAFDHAILPVSSLSTARQRLIALGFTVAADARHPFGTENCCVFFGDDTYLEPLAIGQREDCELSALKGNQFTRRDQAFRFRNGDNGFSSIALKTDTADKDHKRFKKAGVSAGKKLIFGRTIVDPSGKQAKVTFKLAFSADLRAPDAFLFTCQRMNVPQVDRSGLQQHQNTVTGIATIVASEANPSDYQYWLQDVMDNRETDAHSFGMSVTMTNSELDVLTPEGMHMRYGVDRQSSERGVRFEGIVFKVKSLDAVRVAAQQSGTMLRQQGGMLIADPSDGQGAFFAFIAE